MSASRQMANPFYVLLVVVGVLFVITASAYGLMTLRLIEPDGESNSHQLMAFMDEHGFLVLMVELGVLAVATVAAISTDSWWTGETRKGGYWRAGPRIVSRLKPSKRASGCQAGCG